MVNPELIGLATNAIAFIIIAYYALRISRIKKENLIPLMPNTKKFGNDIKFLFMATFFAAILITVRLYYEYFFATNYPPLVLVVILVLGLMSLFSLTALFVRWGRRMIW